MFGLGPRRAGYNSNGGSCDSKTLPQRSSLRQKERSKREDGGGLLPRWSAEGVGIRVGGEGVWAGTMTPKKFPAPKRMWHDPRERMGGKTPPLLNHCLRSRRQWRTHTRKMVGRRLGDSGVGELGVQACTPACWVRRGPTRAWRARQPACNSNNYPTEASCSKKKVEWFKGGRTLACWIWRGPTQAWRARQPASARPARPQASAARAPRPAPWERAFIENLYWVIFIGLGSATPTPLERENLYWAYDVGL